MPPNQFANQDLFIRPTQVTAAVSYLGKDAIDSRAKERLPLKAYEKTTVKITIPTELRVRMSTLGIHVQAVAMKAFPAEVKAREDRINLQKLREGDPRLTSRDLKLRRVRTRRLLGE